MALVAALAFYLHLGRRGGILDPGLDFEIYWNAGRLANAGQDPYVPIWRKLGFVYPPAALLPFRLLALVSLGRAYVAWTVVEAVVVAGVCWLALRRGMSWWWTVPLLVALALNQYTLHCVLMGQVGLVLLGLVVVDVVALSGRRWAGVLTGIAVAVKFTPAVVVLYFVARRKWGAVAMSLAGFLGMLVLGFVLLPSASAQYWGQLLLHHRLGTGVPSQYGAVNNQSLTNAVVLWGGSVGVGRAVAACGFLVGLWAGCLAAVRSRPWSAVAALGTASCLVTGSAWDHHYVWLSAAMVALAAGELRRLRVTSLVVLAWVLWSFVGTWQELVRARASGLGLSQHLQVVATPALALLLEVVMACELWLCTRTAPPAAFTDRRPTGRPGRPRLSSG